MKAGVLLEKAIDILAYDSGSRPNPDYQFPEKERQAIETAEAALALLDGKKLSDVLSPENLAWAEELLHDGADAEALDTFVCGEYTLQTALTKHLGGQGKIANNLICRIFDGNLSDAIIYP